MARKPTRAVGPYVAHGGTIAPEAHVWNGDSHIMTVDTREGADRIAALLNEATRLADEHHLICDDRRWAQAKIAHAVAKAMGGAIDHDVFNRPEGA